MVLARHRGHSAEGGDEKSKKTIGGFECPRRMELGEERRGRENASMLASPTGPAADIDAAWAGTLFRNH